MASYKEQLEFLKAIPSYEQGSKEWLNQRRGKLTSSDVATAIGANPYKKPVQLLLEKCGAGVPFTGNEYTEHGHKYEREAVSKYEMLMGKKTHEFGMISFSDLDPIRRLNPKRHKYIDEKYHFLGGSPDGITEDVTPDDKSHLMQLEIKCPFRRKPRHGEIPSYYLPQVQMNMFIMELESTDFVEYIPSELGSVELNIVRIYRDDEWFDEQFPILEQFWKDVQYWRTQDITTHPEYEKYYSVKTYDEPENLFIDDDDNVRPRVSSECLFE